LSSDSRPEGGASLASAIGPTILTLAVHGIAGCAVAAVLVMVVPRYEQMFADTGMALPAVTLLVLRLSAFTKTYLVLFAPPLFLADGVVYFALREHGPTRGLSRAWSALVMVVLLLCAAVIVIGLQVPMRSLMTEIGSS